MPTPDTRNTAHRDTSHTVSAALLRYDRARSVIGSHSAGYPAANRPGHDISPTLPVAVWRRVKDHAKRAVNAGATDISVCGQSNCALFQRNALSSLFSAQSPVRPQVAGRSTSAFPFIGGAAISETPHQIANRGARRSSSFRKPKPCCRCGRALMNSAVVTDPAHPLSPSPISETLRAARRPTAGTCVRAAR